MYFELWPFLGQTKGSKGYNTLTKLIKLFVCYHTVIHKIVDFSIHNIVQSGVQLRYVSLSIECLMLDVVSPVRHQVVQTNYHSALTRGIQFVCAASMVCYRADDIQK